MATRLKNLEITEISGVDKGANPGAKAVLVKRDYKAEDRKEMAANGEAMSDGSYPIKDGADLENAIHAVGRGSNNSHAAIRRHIIARAKALGLSDKIPEDWAKGGVKKDADGDDDDSPGGVSALLQMLGRAFGMGQGHAYGDDDDPADADMTHLDFDAAYAAGEAKECAADILEEVEEAVQALYRSIHSILDDETVPDPEAAVKQTVDQFKAHMAELVPEELEKALAKFAKRHPAGRAGNQTVTKGNDMTDDIKKALADKDAEIAKLKADLAKAAEMTDGQKAYHDGLDGEGKAKFAAMGHADRNAEMEKKSLRKRAEDALPEPIKKALAEAEDLRKRLAALEAKDEETAFVKRAADAGLPADLVPYLRTIAKADPKAADAVEKMGKQLAAILKTSDAFREIGTDHGADATTAMGQLEVKADEIAKRDKVTKAVAFTKACNENPELYSQHRAESAGRVA